MTQNWRGIVLPQAVIEALEEESKTITSQVDQVASQSEQIAVLTKAVAMLTREIEELRSENAK